MISRSGLRSDCGSFHKLSGRPQRARIREDVCLPCVCQTLPGGPDRVFPASRPSRGVFSCVALGLPGHPPKGVVPRYPPRGVLRDWSRPVPGSCRGVVSPLTGGFPQSSSRRKGRAPPCPSRPPEGLSVEGRPRPTPAQRAHSGAHPPSPRARGRPEYAPGRNVRRRGTAGASRGSAGGRVWRAAPWRGGPVRPLRGQVGAGGQPVTMGRHS